MEDVVYGKVSFLLSADRAPVGTEGLELVERRLLVGRQFQEIGEARRSLKHRADLDQRVITPPTLGHGHALAPTTP